MVRVYLGAASFLFSVALLQGIAQSASTVTLQNTSEDFHLLKFKGSISVDPFLALIDWTSANPLCNWTGITCDSNNNVIHLNLPNKFLKGIIAPDIVNLKNLQYLNLQNNSLSGEIPAGLGYLRHLLELRLGFNLLSGSIPDDFWSLQVVSHMYLNNNKLAGPIPPKVGTLQSLQILDIHGNSFSGKFPVEVFGLPTISTLDIRNNNFSGVVPAGKPGLSFRYSKNAYLSICRSCSVRALADTTTPDSRDNQMTGKHLLLALAAIVGVVSSLALLIVLAIIYYCWRLQKKNKRKFQGEDDRHAWTAYTRQFSLNQLKRATKNFSPDSVIGLGGFGTVYKAAIDTCEIVAIKRSMQESYQGVHEFHNEVQLLSRIHHKNLVNLVGFCEEEGERMLVYEYAPNGSLLEHIVGEKGLALTWRQRVQIAIGSAKGIAYLHEGCSPAIIHRDIKPSNILLDYDFGAKVSDFGLSKTGPDGGASHVSTQVKGTPGYLDPHYYLSFHLSTFSDVYSFGIILLQLVTAKPAVDHSRKRSQYHIINWVRNSLEGGRLEDILDPRLLAQPYNREVLLEMSRIGLRCVSKDMKERPTMSMVGQELEVAVRKAEMLMLQPLPISPQLQEARTGPNGLQSQKVHADPRKQTKQDSNSSHEYHATTQVRKPSQQPSMDKPLKEKTMEQRTSSQKGNREENPIDKSLDYSLAGLETFHVDLEGFSNINVRCFDSNEWEDYHSMSTNHI